MEQKIYDDNKPVKSVIDFFDKLEDKIRGHLSRYPIVYAFIGGVSVVLFWRAVWHTADILQAKGGWLEIIFYEPYNLVIATAIMMATGLFVSFFIGDTILMAGLKGQKKATEKTKQEVEAEEQELNNIRTSIKEMKKEIDEIREKDGPYGIRDLKMDLEEIKKVIGAKKE